MTQPGGGGRIKINMAGDDGDSEHREVRDLSNTVRRGEARDEDGVIPPIV